MENKTIVFGKGFFGKRISEKFDYQLSALDPIDRKGLEEFLDHEKPNVVINCIGKTGRPNIDWCETHKEETISSNIVAPTNISIACNSRKIYFVHIGSGCMYDGDNGGKGHSEEDEPNFYGPQFYAKTKIISEKILSELGGLQLRIRMPIDDRPHERTLIDKLKKYSKLIDAKNSMTTVPHMLTALDSLISKRKEGIYNMVNPGLISAAEIMTLYQEIIDPSYTFELLSLNNLDKITLGKRSNCYLSTEKLQKEGIILPEIHEAVKECLINYKTAMVKV